MIQAINLSFGYRNDQTILNHLDFQLASGTITGLLGKNGVGKTTLLRVMAGLLYPTFGSIHVNGCIPQQRLPDFLSDIYYVPEDFYVPDLSIEKYIHVFGAYYPRFDYAKCGMLIQSQDLKLSHKLGKLSTGQRKNLLSHLLCLRVVQCCCLTNLPMVWIFLKIRIQEGCNFIHC